MGILEKIKDIEQEMARTQKNKATEYHLGLLKAKLAKYRAQLLEPDRKAGSGKGEGFDVMKSGDARVVMIGFPSVGKSTLLNTITNTHSEAANYEFTTLTCIPGKIEYNGAQIQLLDLPGIIEGASQGKGRGRQVVAVAKTSDLVLMLLDSTKSEKQRELLEKELFEVGIRLNRTRPNVYFKVSFPATSNRITINSQIKSGGGITINSMVKLTHLSDRLIQSILHDYKIFNAEVLFKEDATVDDLIDVILGNRKYIPCLYVYTKIDAITMEEIDKLARRPHSTMISCDLQLNLEGLVEAIWKKLGLVRVYTKRRGEYPDLEGGLVLRRGATVEHVCHSIHRSLTNAFRCALVWGQSAKHQPQKVGLLHSMSDEDVIQIVKKN